MKTEKRSVERYAYPGQIEYVTDLVPSDVCRAVTINISQKGLGLYAFSPLAEGQEIVIQSDLPVRQRRATIRWIMNEHDALYKMGAKFISEVERRDDLPGKA